MSMKEIVDCDIEKVGPYFSELPDDTGERIYNSELPDDTGKNNYFSELPDDIGEYFSDISEKCGKLFETEIIKDEQKIKIKEETGWSDVIIDSLRSIEEYEIYREAGLVEVEIGDKKCLIRNDIDWNQKDVMGRTNKQRAEQGLSPINKDAKVIELHHIGQHENSPLAELTTEEHRGKGNDTILHNKTKDSEINRKAFAGERTAHWEIRANEGR